MLDCGVDDFFKVLWYNRVMLKCVPYYCWRSERVLLHAQVEESRYHCRCGLWCRMWCKWYMYVV